MYPISFLIASQNRDKTQLQAMEQSSTIFQVIRMTAGNTLIILYKNSNNDALMFFIFLTIQAEKCS